MLARTTSIALVGIEAHLVDVEVNASDGVPAWTLIGLPARSVREAVQRVDAAITASEGKLPKSKVLVNLAPAGLPKDGTHFDLALAVGLLVSLDRLPETSAKLALIGELGLDGSVRHVRGVLSAALAAKRAGLDRLICPSANAREAAAVDGLRIVPVGTLDECIAYLRGEWSPPGVEAPDVLPSGCPLDLQDVRGQEVAKQAIEVAAAGGHNLLLSGAPGSGKTMLARRFPTILPGLTREEAVEVTRVHSVAGLLPEGAGLMTSRPFRSPHHHVSAAGLIGGGVGLARPGEVVLAHCGALFLDEMPLFGRHLLESLRAPIEDGVVRIARSEGVVRYPCRFVLIGAMNPCPCGYALDPVRTCTCSPHECHAYARRLSGPLLDRFDLQVGVLAPHESDLLGAPQGPTSADVRARVEAARQAQRARYGGDGDTNASVPAKLVRHKGSFTSEAIAFLRSAFAPMGLSARGLDKVMRVGRTIADLQGCDRVERDHVVLALNFRLDPQREGAAA